MDGREALEGSPGGTFSTAMALSSLVRGLNMGGVFTELLSDLMASVLSLQAQLSAFVSSPVRDGSPYLARLERQLSVLEKLTVPARGLKTGLKELSR